jgi:hypothetical protein
MANKKSGLLRHFDPPNSDFRNHLSRGTRKHSP